MINIKNKKLESFTLLLQLFKSTYNLINASNNFFLLAGLGITKLNPASKHFFYSYALQNAVTAIIINLI